LKRKEKITAWSEERRDAVRNKRFWEHCFAFASRESKNCEVNKLDNGFSSFVAGTDIVVDGA